MFSIFKKLGCEHSYKYYNTEPKYPNFLCVHRDNYFQFVCTKCGHVVEVGESEIENRIIQLKAEYNKQVALGGEKIKSSKLTIKKHMSWLLETYESPAVTLLIDEYLKYGIDLREICPDER